MQPSKAGHVPAVHCRIIGLSSFLVCCAHPTQTEWMEAEKLELQTFVAFQERVLKDRYREQHVSKTFEAALSKFWFSVIPCGDSIN